MFANEINKGDSPQADKQTKISRSTGEIKVCIEKCQNEVYFDIRGGILHLKKYNLQQRFLRSS